MKGIWILLISTCFALSAQTTISGVINSYAKVTSINTTCNSVQTNNNGFFAVGDRVLLIQMKGATQDEAALPATTYGTITAANNAGNYEFNEVFAIVGSDIYLKNSMRSYTVSGLVQMITVPQYTDAEVTAKLTAQPWDGNVGGVLVLEATGDILLNAPINLDELGFKGGLTSSTSGTSCTGAATYGYTQPTISAGQKGEGVTVTALGAGRGNQANGGGGGNNHNSGGGGGANYGAGGNGGNRASAVNLGLTTCTSSGCTAFGNFPGIGGVSLSSYYSSKIFLGGGGGGGQQNNLTTFPGANGGGIIILVANRLISNGNSITAKGGTVYEKDGSGNILPANSLDLGDGNGAGGAGGVIILDLNTLQDPTTLSVDGGKGGDTNDKNSLYNCKYFGTGAGGGGGAIILKNSYAQALSSYTGGLAGYSFSHGSNYGATNGAIGGLLTGTPFRSSTLFNQTCITPTPIKLLSYSASAVGSSVELDWNIISDDERYFIVERSADAQQFQVVATLAKNGTSHYSCKDLMPFEGISYYRLSYVDENGKQNFLGTRKVNRDNAASSIQVIPNPASEEVRLVGIDELALVRIVDLNGKELSSSYVKAGEVLSLASYPKGMYLLHVSTSGATQILKLVKE